MEQRHVNLILIAILLIAAVWIDLPQNPGIKIGNFEKRFETVLGLDLRGGMQVILSVPPEISVTQQNLQDAAIILENRSNALGVSEVVFQTAGERIIVGEFPGATNAEEVINKIRQVGQLEFVDFGDTPLPEGTLIETDFGLTENSAPESTPTAASTETPTPETTPEASPTPVPTRYHTVLTGRDLKSVGVSRDTLGRYVVDIEFTDEGARIFKEWTTQNVGKYLGIVLDKRVISSPVIREPITEGRGQIEGNFTSESANALAVQLRYGALPIPLNIEQIRVVGPTLGQDSLQKSLLAGVIGFIIVMLFMGIYYRLPGVVANLALLTYAAITFAIFKTIPVTLTLPGIAGFLLSTGSALDANILIFERLKEELRNGRNLRQALDLGWKRAWSSIRDSNISALITSAILFWFGSTFGASFVKGFALTLALGVMVSLFTALVVTRALLETAVFDLFKDADKKPGWFGL
ncbi:protein translocase subunit SecD [uncultured Thermanaerothrix sp.]|uniref:protein translocase subunit SecD n=1 Tax=uncultured Thermanaerothrix sp. TaxID=1195149 RepID=UPI0026297C71|nr:protein translocase subunit SecD [uncultured Thermanaerothrix sp.]